LVETATDGEIILLDDLAAAAAVGLWALLGGGDVRLSGRGRGGGGAR